MITTFSFFGSSKDSIAIQNQQLVETIFDKIFSKFDSIRVISGGYDGIMKLVSKIAKEKAKSSGKYIEIYGILYVGYGTDEAPNQYLDKSIMTNNLGARVQTMIEMSDFAIALQGSEGTLHEILQLVEGLKYPPNNYQKIKWSNFLIHDYWAGKIPLADEANINKISFFNQQSFEINI